MSVADRLRTWVLRGMVKASSLPVPFVPEWQRVQFLSPTFRALCQEGVRANGIVFNCLETIVFAYPEPRLRVYKETSAGLEPVPNHPLQALLNNPNPQMGQAEMLQYVALYKAISGNCYLYKVRSQARKVVELLPLNDSQITPVAGATLPIHHYDWHNEETGTDEPIPAVDIVHLKWMPDPIAPWRGLAPLMAVAREVDVDAAARKYLFALLRNDAIPRVALVMPPGSKPLSVDEHKRYTEQFQERYGGENRGKPAILGGGLDIKTIGLNLQELAFEALSRVPEARIAGAFRVPPVLAFLNVGLEHMTYNNVSGMRRVFTEGTLVPLWRMDADEIDSDLLPEFGGSAGLVVAFDTSNVVALQEAVAEKRTWVQGAVSTGYMLVNEGRAALGLPAVQGGDVFLRSLVMQEVPALLGTPAGGKALLPARTETKARADRRTMMLALIAAQRQNRADVAGRMEPALDGWFGGLADRVIHRALEAGKGQARSQRKAMLDWEQLLFDSDNEELTALVKRFYVELLQLSWDGWNLELGVDVAFDLGDPAVTKALESAGARVKAIQETTRGALQNALQFGSDNGWSIDHLVRGDAALGQPGLRDLIEQTYKGRARAIARTELGTAQNTAAASRYARAGVDRVLVLDNGVADSDPACQVLGNGGQGTIMSLAWAQANPLQHPNCLRAVGAAFPDDGPIDIAAQARWQAAGESHPVIGGPSEPTAPAPFRPAATVAEAEAWARETYPNIAWDFSGAHIDAVNPTLQQFEQLAKGYPEVAARLQKVGTSLEGENALHFAANPKSAAAFTTDGWQLGLNPALYSDPAKLTGMLAEARNLRFVGQGTASIQGILTHEYGHAVEAWLQGSGNRAATTELNKFMMSATGARQISKYAATHIKEAWAEGFAVLQNAPEAVSGLAYVAKQQKLLASILGKVR